MRRLRHIYCAMDEPFRSSLPSTLLNIGQFLLAKFAMREEMPLGVSRRTFSLCEAGEAMGHMLARFAYSKPRPAHARRVADTG